MKPVLLTPIICALFALTGCANLRFAPTEPQKQLAFTTHRTALTIDAQGAEAASPATQQLVEGTAVALKYTGLPADPEIVDYPTTLEQADTDAGGRPTVVDVMETAGEGLSLLEGILLALGIGGTTIGGKKLIDVIKDAREKNQALKELIAGNELTKNYLSQKGDTAALGIFSAAQNTKQSEATQKLVAVERVGVKTPDLATAPNVTNVVAAAPASNN